MISKPTTWTGKEGITSIGVWFDFFRASLIESRIEAGNPHGTETLHVVHWREHWSITITEFAIQWQTGVQLRIHRTLIGSFRIQETIIPDQRVYGGNVFLHFLHTRNDKWLSRTTIQTGRLQNRPERSSQTGQWPNRSSVIVRKLAAKATEERGFALQFYDLSYWNYVNVRCLRCDLCTSIESSDNMSRQTTRCHRCRFRSFFITLKRNFSQKMIHPVGE